MLARDIGARRVRRLLSTPPTGVTVDDASAAGAAYVFESSNGSLIETQKLTASDAGENNFYGWSGALSGKWIFVGAYIATADEHERQGAVYIDAPHRVP